MTTPLHQASVVVANEAKRTLKIEKKAIDVVITYANRAQLGEHELKCAIKALEKALK